MKNIDNFLSISDSDISKKFTSEYLHLIDGFEIFPASIFYYLEDGEIKSKPLHAEDVFISSYNDMIEKIKKLRISNYVILYSVQPFYLRAHLIPLTYNLLGYECRIKRRLEKINNIINE